MATIRNILRKMSVPYKNFQANTIISPVQMNDNMQEIEYVFNNLFDRVSDTYTKDEIEIIKSEGNQEIIKMITDLANDSEQTAINVYNSMQELTDVEISDILSGGTMNPVSDGFVTDEELLAIVNGSTRNITDLDLGTFTDRSMYNIDGGEF